MGWREARVWCLQVLHGQSGSMGRKSVAYSFRFRSRCPHGTRADPKRYRGEGGVWLLHNVSDVQARKWCSEEGRWCSEEVEQ